MRRNSSPWCLLLTLMIPGLLLTACKAQATPSSTAGAWPTPISTQSAPLEAENAVVITFACLGYETSAYEQLAGKFHESNPGITVQVIPLEEIVGEDNEFPLQELASGADTLVWRIEPYMTRRGLFKDLAPFIEADRNFQPDDFYPSALESLQWDGGTWGLPAGIEFSLIFYDKAAFDVAEVPYPEPGWTWDDFLEKAILLTEREGDTFTRWGFVGLRPEDPLPFIAGRVGSLVDYSTTPPTPLLDQPPVSEAVRWYTDLYLKYQVMPYLESSPCESEGYCESAGEFLIANGQAAMWSDLSTNFERRNRGREIGMVPYPVEKLNDATTPILAWPVYALSAGTSYPEESWRWLDFLSRQRKANDRGVFPLPARRSVAEEMGYWESLDEEVAAAYKFALEHSIARREGDDVLNALNNALDTIIKNEQNIETALADAQMALSQDLYGQLLEQVPPQKLVVATPKIETNGGTVIVFALSFAPFYTDAAPYREIAKMFHDSHPEITVDVKEPYFATRFGLKEMASSSDCFFWYNELPDEEFSQLIISLNPFLDAEPDFLLNEFYTQTLDAFRWQGDLWALPAEVQMQVIYYNKDLFDTVGVAYPQLSWDPDMFLNTARALTRGDGDGKQYGFLSLYDDASELITFIFLQGASPMDEQTDPPKPYFDNPDVVRAVRWYAELTTIHGVKPIFPGEEPSRVETTAWDVRKSLVNMGRVALWSNFIGTVISSPNDVRTGITSLPSDGGKIPGWFVQGYYISKDTPYPQQCWEWIKFLSEHSVEVVKGPPARRSVMESPDFRAKVGEEVAEAFLFSMAHVDKAHPWYAIYAPPRTYYWLVEAYGRILKGEEPGRALAEAQGKAEAYIACLEIKGNPADEAVQKACAQEADPSYRELYE